MALAVVLVVLVRLGLLAVTAAQYPGAIEVDLHCVMDATRRWLAGDGYVLARQLDGPYLQQGATARDLGEVLCPPVALYLFVPFSFLPELLWWLAPAALSVVALRRLRAAPRSWPLLALLLGASANGIIAGNPSIWLVPAAL